MQQIFREGMQDFIARNRADEMLAQADKFSWEQAANQYLELYSECLLTD